MNMSPFYECNQHCNCLFIFLSAATNRKNYGHTSRAHIKIYCVCVYESQLYEGILIELRELFL